MEASHGSLGSCSRDRIYNVIPFRKPSFFDAYRGALMEVDCAVERILAMIVPQPFCACGYARRRVRGVLQVRWPPGSIGSGPALAYLTHIRTSAVSPKAAALVEQEQRTSDLHTAIRKAVRLRRVPVGFTGRGTKDLEGRIGCL